MTQTAPLVLLLAASALIVAAAGLAYAWKRRSGGNLEGYITSRGSIGGIMAGMSLFASGMGSWILFGPAEAATWGGLPNIVGYAVGSALPLFLFIWFGKRLRRLMPNGHALTEYVQLRYGPLMHRLTLVVMTFYLFIFLAAEVTGLALMVRLAAGTPLWISASIVLGATLLYTTLGGLRASIFTDGLQTAIIIPLGAILVVATAMALGGPAEVHNSIRNVNPDLLTTGFKPGIGGALTLLIGMTAAGLFDQAIWQRVYASRTESALRTGFLTAGLAIIPVVFVLGWFGLAAVSIGEISEPSMAFFHVVSALMSPVFVWCLLVLGVLLVMSSADSIINGISSLLAVEMHRIIPSRSSGQLLNAARWSTIVLAAPVFFIAVQGYSVLYLFLVADLLCAAAVAPVFAGLWLPRLSNQRATLALIAGLIAGLVFLPGPKSGGSALGLLLESGSPFAEGSLLISFLLAGVLPLVCVLLPSRGEPFDYKVLGTGVKEIH